MAVERKDRFVELLRDQNDELKEKVSKLDTEKRKDVVERSAQEKMYLVKEVHVYQPSNNNTNLWTVVRSYGDMAWNDSPGHTYRQEKMERLG